MDQALRDLETGVRDCNDAKTAADILVLGLADRLDGLSQDPLAIKALVNDLRQIAPAIGDALATAAQKAVSGPAGGTEPGAQFAPQTRPATGPPAAVSSAMPTTEDALKAGRPGEPATDEPPPSDAERKAEAEALEEQSKAGVDQSSSRPGPTSPKGTTPKTAEQQLTESERKKSAHKGK